MPAETQTPRNGQRETHSGLERPPLSGGLTWEEFLSLLSYENGHLQGLTGTWQSPVSPHPSGRCPQACLKTRLLPMELEDSSGSRAATSTETRDAQDPHRHACADPQPSTARDFWVEWGQGTGAIFIQLWK